LTSPEDLSQIFGEFHHDENLKFKHFGESIMIMANAGLIWASGKESMYCYFFWLTMTWQNGIFMRLKCHQT